jgi:hypothetical protein
MIDEIRDRLAALDPMRDVAIDPVGSDRARTLLEAVMSRPLTDSPVVSTGDSTGLSTGEPFRPKRRWSLLAGIAGLAVVAVVAVGVVVGNNDGSDDTSTATPPLALTLPESDVMAMCLAIDATFLSDAAEQAFAGTVSEVGEGFVTLDVDRWYRGGDATSVQISTPAGFIAAMDGVDFVVGSRYLVAAAGGQVLGCGMSGPASPEFEQLFETAFAS